MQQFFLLIGKFKPQKFRSAHIPRQIGRPDREKLMGGRLREYNRGFIVCKSSHQNLVPFISKLERLSQVKPEVSRLIGCPDREKLMGRRLREYNRVFLLAHEL